MNVSVDLNKVKSYKMHRRQKRIISVFGKEPETLDEIAKSCIAMINTKATVVGFVWDIEYNQRTSNSHHAPIGGTTNWGNRNPGAPRHYPGFEGRVWIRFSKPPSFAPDLFNLTLTYPGTGGGGSYDSVWNSVYNVAWRSRGIKNFGPRRDVFCYSWDYRFFLSDFPKYQIKFEKQHDRFLQETEWNLLKGCTKNPIFKLKHRFNWNDLETIEADKEFLNSWAQFQKEREFDTQ